MSNLIEKIYVFAKQADGSYHMTRVTRLSKRKRPDCTSLVMYQPKTTNKRKIFDHMVEAAVSGASMLGGKNASTTTVWWKHNGVKMENHDVWHAAGAWGIYTERNSAMGN